MTATLNDLSRIRGQLAEGLEAYLQSFVDLSAWNKVFLFLPDPSSTPNSVSRLYQRPNVVNRERLDDTARKRRREADLRWEFGLAGVEEATTRWATERRDIRCALILGRPGEGKTLLTQLTCRAVARLGLARLRSRRFPISDIPIPLWFRVEDVLAAGSIQTALDNGIPAVVARAIQRRFHGRDQLAPSHAPAANHIRRALGQAGTWLFLDAIDERGRGMQGEEPADPAVALAELKDVHERVRVVITGRVHEYRKEHDLPPNVTVTEYELEALNQTQQRALIHRWFVTDQDKLHSTLGLLDAHEQFRDMASNGLMLTLICFAAKQHDIGPTTRRVNLYELILRDMVRRAHKANPLAARNQTVGRRLEVLRAVVWSFFRLNPSDPALDETDWDKRVARASARYKSSLFAINLTADVREAGLVVSHQDGFVRFIHRSFYQYLAASYLARMKSSARLATIRDHIADNAWRETILMAVGHLGLVRRLPREAGKLVEDTIRKAPGPPGVAVALMGDAIVDAGPECIPADTLARLRIALLRTMRSDGIDGRDPYVPPKVRAAAGSALGRLGDPRFHTRELWCLPKYFSDPRADGELEPDDMLGFVEIPAGEFWMGSNTT